MTSQLKTSVTINDNAVQDGQTIDAADVTTAFDDAQSELREGWVGVSANDANVKHLEDAIVGGTGITATTVDDGADETVSIAVDDTVVATTSNSITLASKTLTTPTIADFTNATHDHQDASGGGQLVADAIDSETATNGYVLTADGSGGASWASVGGGGVQPIDLTVTAGETLALRDMVYLDESSGTWFKLDVDATSSIKCGALRGCVNEAGGIASASTGSVRILGEVSGFTGLTAWTRVYGTTTAGSYTQTRPAVSDGGSQVAIAEMGYAVSTAIVFVDPKPVIYAKRETLANDGTLSIEHHSDAQTRKRDARAYVGTTVAGSTLTEYADSNQDDDVILRTSDVGGTETITASGNVTNLQSFRVGQSWQCPATGTLTQFTVELSNATSTVNWEIQADDNSGDPGGTTIASGSFSSSIGTNTINPSSPPFLVSGTTYWLLLEETSNAVYWQASATSTYANGVGKYSNDGGSTWSPYGDYQSAFTITAPTTYDKLAQSFEVTGTQTLASVDLYLKKVGSPTGTMTLRVETDSAGSPSGTLADANLTATLAESGLGTSYADATFTFGTPASISGSTTYWLVLSTDRTASATNYVIWGADTSTPSYADGSMSGESSSSWSALSADAIFSVNGAGTQYDEPCVVGRWSGGTRDIAVRFDDGSAGSPNTQTTFKNTSGGSLDIVAEVEVI